MMKNIELLAPAGSFEKAKIAFLYGADAVYMGTKSLSLRTRVSVDDNELNKTIEYAHKIGKKVYVALNIFAWDEKYDEIIKKAILNHNRPRIEEGLSKRELMHAKIIRDADKLDIYYVLTIEKLENSYGCKDMSKDEITDEIYREFMEDHMINYKNLKTNADMLVAHIAYIFDFYYNYSLKIVKQKGYIEQIEQKVNLENKQAIKLLEKINVIANNYIDETLKLEQREQVQCQKSC